VFDFAGLVKHASAAAAICSSVDLGIKFVCITSLGRNVYHVEKFQNVV